MGNVAKALAQDLGRRAVEYPHQRDMDNLLEKQVQARMYFCKCPFRRALNMRWRAYWNAQAKWPGLSVIR